MRFPKTRKQVLERPELVDDLTRASVDAGINIHTHACVDRIDKKGSRLMATCRGSPGLLRIAPRFHDRWP